MLKRIFALTCLAASTITLGVSSTAPAHADTSKDFSVLNYNVMMLSSTLYPHHMQDFRAGKIPEVIRNSGQWDVIVVNEAFDNGPRGKLLVGLIGSGYPFMTEVVDINNARTEDGGVYIQSRWPIVATDKIIFSDCSGSDCLANKGAIYAKIDKGGTIYHVFGTHLQADSGNSGVRANQLGQLRAFIEQKTSGAKSRGEAVIISGDLNFDYGTSEYNKALNIVNAQFMGNIPGDHTFDPASNDLAKYRYPDDSAEWLDYVLISNQGIQPSSTSLDVMKFRTSQYEIPGAGDIFNLFGGTMVRDLSDHYGLSAKYSFSPATTNSFNGTWNTDFGQMNLNVNNGQTSGSYTSDNGRIQGVVNGQTLVGYWIEDGSDRKCNTSKQGSFHWGRIEYILGANGQTFNGQWSYCDDPIAGSSSAWNGTKR